jgi:parallel beta-helix repeat protein
LNGVRSFPRSLALLALVAGVSGCKKKNTYVHVEIRPDAAEPAGITTIDLQLALGAQTASKVLTDPGGAALQLPTDVTLQIQSGSGPLTITAIARNAVGAEVDRGTTTVEVVTDAIAEAVVQLPGGKAEIQAEAQQPFGIVAQGQASAPAGITFQNIGFKLSGSGPLSVALGGAGASAFAIVTNGCSGSTLAPGASCIVSVKFQPTTIGDFSATLTADATPGGPAVVALTGTGAPPQNLTVTVAGAGSGNVKSNETTPKINCGNGGTACSTTYNYGTGVTLTETPAVNSTFTGWSGGGCSGTAATCTVPMTQAQSVTATFVVKTIVLTVTTAGNGIGNVKSSPSGINCGNGATTCSFGFNYGTNLTFTATPATNIVFTGWSGACPLATGNCPGTITAPVTVTANFNLSFCATGGASQIFSGLTNGCAGAVTFDRRGSLCAAGTHVCTANEFVATGGVPTHHYWTDDALNYSFGTGPCGTASCSTNNCFASPGTTYTTVCSATTPMRVCSSTTPDAEGNTCNWINCGFNSISPNQHFGGCNGNTTAGALCCFGAPTYFVDAAGGSDANPGSSTSPFKTIKRALALATTAGQQVNVRPGTYNSANGEVFPLQIPAGVSLIGDEPNRGAGATPTTISGTVNVGANATIAGFTVNTAGGTGIVVNTSGPTVRNNTVTGNFLGISLAGSSNHLVVLNAIINNNPSSGATGLYNESTAASSGRAENNTVTGNPYGVYFYMPASDLGGAGSVGNNILSCNTTIDVGTTSAVASFIRADNNFWDHVPPTTGTGSGADISPNTTVVTAANPKQASPFCP